MRCIRILLSIVTAFAMLAAGGKADTPGKFVLPPGFVLANQYSLGADGDCWLTWNGKQCFALDMVARPDVLKRMWTPTSGRVRSLSGTYIGRTKLDRKIIIKDVTEENGATVAAGFRKIPQGLLSQDDAIYVQESTLRTASGTPAFPVGGAIRFAALPAGKKPVLTDAASADQPVTLPPGFRRVSKGATDLSPLPFGATLDQPAQHQPEPKWADSTPDVPKPARSSWSRRHDPPVVIVRTVAMGVIVALLMVVWSLVKRSWAYLRSRSRPKSEPGAAPVIPVEKAKTRSRIKTAAASAAGWAFGLSAGFILGPIVVRLAYGGISDAVIAEKLIVGIVWFPILFIVLWLWGILSKKGRVTGATTQVPPPIPIVEPTAQPTGHPATGTSQRAKLGTIEAARRNVATLERFKAIVEASRSPAAKLDPVPLVEHSGTDSVSSSVACDTGTHLEGKVMNTRRAIIVGASVFLFMCVFLWPTEGRRSYGSNVTISYNRGFIFDRDDKVRFGDVVLYGVMSAAVGAIAGYMGRKKV